MKIERYIRIPVLKSQSGKLIPIWDNKIKFEEDDYFGDHVIYSNTSCEKSYDFDFGILDLKTKNISAGIEIDIYPADLSHDSDFKTGQQIYYELESNHRTLKESKIKDIIFEKFEIEILLGNHVDHYYIELFKKKKITVDPEKLYCLKRWTPWYVLEDDTVIKWEYKLYKKFNN